MHRSNRLNVVRINGPDADEEELNAETEENEIQGEQQDNDDHNISVQDSGVRKRGETLLAHVWNLPAEEHIVVKCNMFGQPIGKEGGLLGQFLGTVARNGGYCPLNIKDWRLVKKNGGDKTIIDFVKTKFLYPRSCEKWILKSVGRDWRQSKAALKKAFFNVKKKKSVLYRRCPEDVDEDQWIGLVKHWKSKRSKRQADPQKKQPHRARVYLATHKQKGEHKDEHAEKLQGIIEEQPELAQNNEGKVVWEGDALHSVLGEENPGHVHGLGMLPVPKQAYGQKLHLLKDINTTTLEVEGPVEITLLEEMEKMKEQLKKQDQIIEDLQNKQTRNVDRDTREVIHEVIYADNFQPHVVNSKRKRVECESPSAQGSMNEQEDMSRRNMKKTQEQVTRNMIQHRGKKSRPSAMAIGTTVVLKSAKYPNKEDVAYASFVSCDPSAEVGGVAIGKQFWKVRVTFPMDENEELVRPWGNFKTLGDVKGKPVAWPSVFDEKVNG